MPENIPGEPNPDPGERRATRDLCDIQHWPSYVLIDRWGSIRFEGAGEFHLEDGTYDQWDGRIRKLLAER